MIEKLIREVKAIADNGVEYVDKEEYVDAVVIPDNATNIDVIKLLFPSGTQVKGAGIFIMDDKRSNLNYDINWGNAPYNLPNSNKEGMINKYIKKPIEVEALQIHGNVSEIKDFIGENGDVYIDDVTWKAGAGQPHTIVIIHTLEGDMQTTDGDYIIKGIKGEFYICRKDIFEETYELVESEEQE